MKQMNILNVSLLLFTALIMNACCGNSSCDTGDEKEKKEDKTSSKTCLFSALSFNMEETKKTLQAHYNEGKLVSIDEVVDTTIKQAAKYEYNENGQLSAINYGVMQEGNDSSVYKFIYDENNRLIKLEGVGNLQTRTFEYNDNDQIEKQLIMWDGKPYNIKEYGYDEKGLPVEIKDINTNGEVATIYSIEYDGNPNPLIQLGPILNINDILYGYPIACAEHNIKSIITTYKKDSPWKINGKEIKAGMVDTTLTTYTYNNSGYPTSLDRNQSKINFEYTCE